MKNLTAIFAGVALFALTSCSPSGDAGAGSSAEHHHDPPHGGTGVVLGDEDFHLEFVLDAAAGKMQAYILSAHMDNFVRISTESFALTVKLPDREETLLFKPVANSTTGETAGDTSMFEAQADWLKTQKTFDAVLKEISIKGKPYQNVAFNFPKGN